MAMQLPSASQIASAQCHLSRREDWRVYRAAGVRYIAMPSGRSKHVYQVRADARGCSCPAYQDHGYMICSHMLAAREAAHHDALRDWLDDQTDELMDEYDSFQAENDRLFSGYTKYEVTA